MKAKKIRFYFLNIAALLALGFYRDFLFKAINALLKAWDSDMDYYMPPGLRFFENMDYGTIVNIKWFLTILFSIFYLLITLIIIRYRFLDKKYLHLTVLSYLILFFISGVFILIGFVFPPIAAKMYVFARYFMGMAQSPIVLMILFPTFIIFEKEMSNQPKE